MNRKHIQKTVFTWLNCIVLTVAGGLSSCDFLSIEDYINDDLALDSIFSSVRYVEAHMWGAATGFHDEGALFGNGMYTPGPLATDEGFSLFSTSEFQGMGYVMGAYNASNLGRFDNWSLWYRIIRQCSTILARMDEAHDMTIDDRFRIMGNTRFIRAYAYYNLLMNFGPVVLLGDEILPNNEELVFYNRPRDLYDDCVEYICTELEEAARYLDKRVNSIVEFGRPTKGAAYGLIARLRLQHASELYNGGKAARTYFGSWTRKTDGKHYIQQKEDPRRWAVAAAAAKRLIDMKDDVGIKMYSLHYVDKDNSTPSLSPNTGDPDYLNPFPYGAGEIDPYHSYLDMFNGESVMSVNPEFIWARTSSQLLAYTRHSFPGINGGDNGMCVTQKIVDAYEMADGHPINNPSGEYPYNESGFTNEMKELYNGYRLNAGVYNMYVNREARFYASIGFSECFWDMGSTSDASQKNLTITYYSDSPNGRDGARTPANYPITGYVIRKFVHPIDAWAGTANRRINKPYAMIRYAEILLAYAEALNHLGTESYTITVDDVPQIFSRDGEEIKQAFNQVRYRAGLPGLTDADLTDADKVMEKIKRERMVEFLFENHRYFDVRRWGDYEASENEPIRGMNTAATKEAYYQRVMPTSSRISDRVVDRKLIFLPIPKEEVKRLPSFDQNPGW
ncbi:RagB/SusD family nutrient uptake outer membrane protein [termite gut metagenome]|uniref:RagB/SusD family nutrient uptake outer membrane protein n=1 Tax=termite gut metagenome TaxID=433724 RepID=A0A5J4SAG5_9ZZZZ